jgi:glycerophosphoryl diester phosphodiesterase
MNTWPYPFWIAHRGAGKLAPENTMAAFRLGAAHGYRMFECDATLSADEVVYLLHDATLERTSNGHGIAAQHTWAQLSALDAGSWHSPAHAGEPLCTLADLANFCLDQGHALNIEIKPSPGQDRQTGLRVAAEAVRLWQGAATAPLLSSFSVPALQAAKDAAPQLPRALLLEDWDDTSLPTALALGCVAIVADHVLWQKENVAQVHAAGLRCLSYTVNDAAQAERLQALGTDGIITDRVDVFSPRAPKRPA